jgi:serine/threonine-protein kinase
LQDIRDYATFTKVEPVEKGWSGERKFYVETERGEKLFLRVTAASELGRKQLEFALMEQAFSLGVSMPRPIHVGLCDGEQSAYSLFTWCEGEDAEAVLPAMPAEEQYVLGIRAGQMLRVMHSLPAPQGGRAWEERFGQKVDRKLELYDACELSFAGDTEIMRYLDENRHLLQGRPQSFQHGDYHVGNMVISQTGNLSIIDFNRFDFGDPWEEFNRIVFSAAISPAFARGQIDGYFGGRPPLLFFQLLAFYIGSNTLSALPWALAFGEGEIETMRNQAQDVLTWFEMMQNPVPSWY